MSDPRASATRQPEAGAGTLVVLATYDERDNLPRLLDAIWRACDVDVLVVDDSSPDGTGAIADRIARVDSRLTVIHRPCKAGLASARVTAFRYALSHRYSRVVEMDADFSHAPEDVPRLVALSDTAEVVVGSRMAPGGRILGRSFWRNTLSRGACAYARAILRLRTLDCTGGFRCSRMSALSVLDLDRITSRGYGFQIELNWAWQVAGTHVREVPIVFRDRVAGRSKMSLGIILESLAVVVKLRMRGRLQDACDRQYGDGGRNGDRRPAQLPRKGAPADPRPAGVAPAA